MNLHRILLSVALTLSAASGALAQGAAKPTLVGTFNDWQTWSYTGSYSGSGGEGKVCYIYAEPEDMSPERLDHGRVSFSVASAPAAGIQLEANFVTGYALREQSSVTVEVDGRKFTMFTQGDSAWLLNRDEEPELLASMKAGSNMVIRAVSGRGNNTTYEYSLRGVTAAADKMSAECTS
jgi:hypothetical protein